MKIALVFSKRSSEWISCRSIVKNLFALYNLSFPEAEIRAFDYSLKRRKCEYLFTAKEIVVFNPDRIAFIDHKPHPLNLIEKLKEVYQTRQFPLLYFHVFGDFPLYIKNMRNNWTELSEVLSGHRLSIICASEKQRRYVSQFFIDAETVVTTCPFPGDEESFFYSDELRMNWRDRLGLKNNEVGVVYSGRLSLQKNVYNLIERLAEVNESKEGRLKLFLAGNFDDLGSPHFGVHFLEGHYYQVCSGLIKRLPSPFKDNIYFLGGIAQDDLNGVLNACDIFCSLSLHHDEDYGMAPLEALLTGLPSILTDWGGYSSFKIKDGNVHLVRTNTGIEGPRICYEDFHLHLQGLLDGIRAVSDGSEERKESRNFYARDFSRGAVAKRLREIHERQLNVLRGTTEKLEYLSISLARLYNNERYSDRYVFKGDKGHLYRELYSAYSEPLGQD